MRFVTGQFSEHALGFLTIEQAARMLRRRELSPVDLTKAALARIESENTRLRAYLTVLEKESLAAARRAEKEIFHGAARSLLHGIPICLKDNICTRGVRTTAGSRIFRNFVPAADSVVAMKLKRAGAILLGKTNLHEFAYGVTSVNPHYGWVRNPWDESRISGGSSGGSAAAVAAGMAYGSVGTDTGGSIRTPSSFCGVVGLKPTYGLVSLEGIVPLAPSLDHAGPMARTVRDVAILLDVIATSDPGRAGGPSNVSSRFPRRIRASALRIGYPSRGCFENYSSEVQRAVSQAALLLGSMGASLREISLKGAEDAFDSANVVARAEATTFHMETGLFPARREEYGEDVASHLEAGLRISAVDYLSAFAARDSLREAFGRTFERVDAILAPTVPIVAVFPDTEKIQIRRRTESMRTAILRFARPANFSGLPSISVPCGFTKEGLPIGLQIITPERKESFLLGIAHLYEQAAGWHRVHPRCCERTPGAN
jgi:aspartyl-tRNA(Asn)/glutamyl-tRNA(Gln) amidotransferase subunit A